MYVHSDDLFSDTFYLTMEASVFASACRRAEECFGGDCGLGNNDESISVDIKDSGIRKPGV